MTILEIPFAYLLQSALFHEELSSLGLLGVALVVSGTVLNVASGVNRAKRTRRREDEPSASMASTSSKQAQTCTFGLRSDHRNHLTSRAGANLDCVIVAAAQVDGTPFHDSTVSTTSAL